MLSPLNQVLTTIGYENASISDFVQTLTRAKIRQLIDVRELAMSRRKGFAKKALSSALADSGIKYIHLRSLGDPKEGREAARRNELELFVEIFSKHILTNDAQEALRVAVELVEEGGVCLMCYERSHTACHRSIVADSISEKTPVSINHITVENGIATNGIFSKTISQQRA